jgi:hypothetical protein
VSTGSAVLLTVALIALYVLLPSLRSIWRGRRILWEALKFRVTEPDLWRECKAEMKRNGEWL